MNNVATGTRSALASLTMLLKDGFRRAASIPAKYVRWMQARSANSSWDQPFSPRWCLRRFDSARRTALSEAKPYLRDS
jgi:hypothetical protein